MTQNLSFDRLPPAVITMIFDQLALEELVEMTFVCRNLRALAIPKLYRSATFSDTSDENVVSFADAIQQGFVCNDVVATISRAKLAFANETSGQQIIGSFLKIKDKLKGLEEIVVSCHYFEEAIWALNQVAQAYTEVTFEISCRSIGVTGAANAIIPSAKQRLVALSSPVIYASVLSDMNNLKSLSTLAIVHNSNVPEKCVFGPFEELKLPYVDWVHLGRPSSRRLDLDLGKNYIYVCDKNRPEAYAIPVLVHEVTVDCHVLEDLKLIGFVLDEKPYNVGALNRRVSEDMLEITIKAPNLRMLFICNIDPNVVEAMIHGMVTPQLEMISFCPVSVPALRALHASKLPLRLVFALVNEHVLAQKSANEITSLARWLQDIARQYPLDLRDFSNRFDREIYFSDGMWCNINQTAYRGYACRAIPQ